MRQRAASALVEPTREPKKTRSEIIPDNLTEKSKEKFSDTIEDRSPVHTAAYSSE